MRRLRAASFLLSIVLLAALMGRGVAVHAQEPQDVTPSEAHTPNACPPDVVFGCLLSGSGPYGWRVQNSSTSSSTYAVWGQALGTTNAGYGVLGTNAGTGAGVYGTSSGTGYGVRGGSANGTGIYASTNGTGTQRGLYGLHAAGTGTGAGVEGRTNSTSSGAAGVRGVATGGVSAGVQGIQNNTGYDGYGVRGSHAGTGTGVFGTSSSGWGVWGQSSSSRGVYGESSIGTGVFGGSDSGTGVWGYSWGYSPSSRGVFGGSDNGIGVSGYSPSSSGTGVRGHSPSGWGVFGYSLSSLGVYGLSRSSVGVRGHSDSGYAGYFSGPVHVTGNLSKAGGAFRIDHPLDPENQTLSHSFVESPDMMNVYNGNVVLDANGEAVVALPAYFDALNRDFRYQLTPIGAFAPLYIAQKIEGNQFRIAGGTEGLEVSWQVTGIRQDVWANDNRIPVEEPKPEDERGTYLYPEGHGQPAERGRDYAEIQQIQEMEAEVEEPHAPIEAP